MGEETATLGGRFSGQHLQQLGKIIKMTNSSPLKPSSSKSVSLSNRDICMCVKQKINKVMHCLVSASTKDQKQQKCPFKKISGILCSGISIPSSLSHPCPLCYFYSEQDLSIWWQLQAYIRSREESKGHMELKRALGLWLSSLALHQNQREVSEIHCCRMSL